MNRHELQTDSRKGVGLALVGGLALSIDIPLLRLAQSDPYMVMVVRGGCIAVVFWIYWRFFADRSDMPTDLLADWDFLIVGGLSGLNSIFFTFAVFNTSTANVVFILAFNAMLAALISWPMNGERPRLHTWVAILATLVGVGIIVSDGFGTGNLTGDLFALACAAVLAFSLSVTRGSGKNLSLAPGFGGLVAAVYALPVALYASPWPEAPEWLLLNSLIITPLAAFTLWLAPRYISAPQVALFYLLETVITPLWIWAVFAEIPTSKVVIGGTIVIGALLGHSFWELRKENRAAN